MATLARREIAPVVLSLHRSLSIWMVGDLLYAVLPIITLALITLSRGETFAQFSLIREWSFAAIVLFGVAIRRTIRLKTEVQRDARSYRLDTAVQMLVVSLVIAVLVLALVLLHEKNVDIGVKTKFLSIAQLTLFGFGAVCLLVITLAEETFSAAANRMPRGSSRRVIARHVLYRLNYALETLDYVGYALQRLPVASSSSATDQVADARRYPAWLRALRSRVDRADQLLEEIKGTINGSLTALEKDILARCREALNPGTQY